jgi:predicted nucleotidyltransferase
MANKDLLVRIASAVRDVDPHAQVLLYGSRARGRASAESDWDLLILLSVPATVEIQRRIRRNLYEIEWETGEVLCSIIHSREDWGAPPLRDTPFRQQVEREAIRV